jgi:hypothetical protein
MQIIISHFATFMTKHIPWARELSVENRMHSQCRCEISAAIKSQFHENGSQSSKVIRRTRKAVYFK